MSTKQLDEKEGRLRFWLGRLLLFAGIPAMLFFFWKFGARRFYLCSLAVIVAAMIPFFLRFEKRKPQARELVTVAVLCAIAVASRAAFAMFPSFKPLVGIVMIAGMAFGAEVGFLTGAISAFVSNFFFGQGMWTPWQMFAYGVGGFLAACFYRWEIIGERDRFQQIVTPIFGFAAIIGVVGPILDVSTILSVGDAITLEGSIAIFLSGLPVNVIHGTATALTLLLLCKPMMEKLNRIKQKYGMFVS